MTTHSARRLVRAIWWIFANSASPRLGTVVIGLVVARWMSPGEFGAFAVAVVALLGIQSLEQVGVGQAMAASHDDPYKLAPTVTTISLVSGAALAGLTYLTAPLYARAMSEPASVGVIRWLAVSVAISAVAASPAAVLRQRSPRAVMVLIEGADNWIAVAVAVGLAANGHALAGLAAGRIVGSCVKVLLSVMFAPRAVRIGFQPRAAKVLMRSALPLVACSALLFAANNVDLIILGRLEPGRGIGFYFLALCLASWSIALCTQPVRDNAPATFARFRRSPQVARSAFRSTMYLVICLTVPLCILIISSAGDIVALLYGPGWAPTATLLAWLAPLSALRVCCDLSASYLSARDSLHTALGFYFVIVISLVPAVLAGVREESTVGAAVAQIVVRAPALLIIHLPTSPRGSLRSPQTVKRLGFRLAVLLAIGMATFSIRRSSDADGWLVLVGGSAISFGTMLLLIRRNRGVLRALYQSGIRSRRVLTPEGLAPILTATVEPVRYSGLTLVPLPSPRRARQRLSERPSVVPDTDEGDLRSKVRSGALWSTLNTLVLRVANFAATVLLARTVFGPKAFGLYAVSQVILAMLLSANEMGVSLAIVRWDEDVRTFARTVCTLGAAASMLLYGILFAIAPQMARVLGSPGATGMVRVLCLCVVIDGLVCVQLALLTRAFAQRRLMLVNTLNFIVSTGVTLWLAFSGKGPISFAWGSVAGCVTALVAATIAAPFFVWPGWNTSQAKRLLRFGLPLAGASLLLLGVYNVDSIIVGATLGPAALGLYALAFNISSWPVRAISEAARRVSFAGFSRLANTADQLANAFARAIALVMAAAVPACVILGTLAEPLIRLIYGQRWIAAAPVLTLLAALGLLRVIYEISYDCLAAAGKRPTLLGVQGWWLATLCPVLLIGARLRGIVGVGAGHILVAGLLVGPAFAWALSRCGIPVRLLLAACARPFIGGILMIAFCELTLHAVGHTLAGMALAAIAGAVVYVPIVFPMRTLLRKAPQDRGLLAEELAA